MTNGAIHFDQSVFELVKQLCLTIYNETTNSNGPPPSPKFLRTTTALAYEILLKKSNRRNEMPDDDACMPLHELQFRRFEMNMLADNYTDKRKCALFDQCLDNIENEHILDSRSMQSIFILLISLKDSVPARPDTDSSVCGLGNFFRASADHYVPYRLVPTHLMRLPPSLTSIFESNSNAGIGHNPYMPNFMTPPKHANEFQFLKLLSITELARCSSKNETLESVFSSRMNAKKPAGGDTLMKKPPKVQQNVPDVRPEKPIVMKSLNWDHLGEPMDSSHHQRPFGAECQAAYLHMLAMQAKCERGTTALVAQIITMAQLIADIKLLLVGTPSDTFSYNAERMCFAMADHVTVENVAPVTMRAWVQGFLECGACCARLKILCGTNVDNFKMKFEGFVFQALCNSVELYLMQFNRFVITFEDTTVLQLSRRMDVMIRQVKMLAKVLAIHPAVYGSKEFPRGSEFLGYLYKEIAEVSLREINMLLVFILEQCCKVYFRFFEIWIFHGCIEDPCKELFIDFIDHYRPNTKYFWDKAYLVKRQSVPGFLQGCEDTTLLCGKYTMLLSAYKPDHALFTVQPPTIDVCLSAEQVQKVQSQCLDYGRRAQAVCGDPITVCSVFKQKAAKKEAFMRQVAERFQQNLAKWKLEQFALRQARQEVHAKDRMILQQQIAEVREKKIQNRREQLAMEREHLRLEQKSEDERIVLEGIQRQNTIDYYTELGEIVDAQRERAEAKVKHLRRQLQPIAVEQSASKTSLDSVYETAREQSDDIEIAGDEEDVYYSTDDLLAEDLKGTAIKEDDVAVQNENYKIERQANDLKKSSSDFFNCNDLIATVITSTTEASRNKTKVLSSAFDFDHYDLPAITSSAASSSLRKCAKKTKNKVVVEKDSNYNEMPAQPLISERQRNKQKVLGQEYDIICPTINVVQPVDNIADTALSDLEKNRQKVLHLEFGYAAQTEFDTNQKKAAHHQHEFMNTDENIPNTPFPTDLQANRKRVMHDNIGDGKHTQPTCQKQNMSLNLESNSLLRNTEIGTPMSTGSDTPMLSERIDEDLVNANTDYNLTTKSSPRKFGNLKLQTNLPTSCAIPVTANLANPTPDSGLNTAGLLAKDGFLFDVSKNKLSLSAAAIRTAYERSADMLTSNFTATTSGTRNRFMQLNIPHCSVGDDDDEQKHDAYVSQLNETRRLNITTITHFLRMSFVIPMQAHLNILNNEILKIYLIDLDILSHFKSLRNYFFMMDGEFASYICDGIIGKLEAHARPTELLNFNVLHSLLDNALGSSIIGNDRNAENLSFIVDELPDVFDLRSPNALQVLSLTYTVEWPLNLLLNSETIAHYAKIFQHLLKLRRIRWVLDKTFEMLKETAKQSNGKRLRSAQFDHVQQIRNKLLGFVNALQNHITSNALQASWRRFKNDLESTKSMEDLYQKHTNYMKRVEFLCMLNKSSHEFYIKLEDVFIIALRFYHKLKARNWRCTSEMEFTHPNFQKLLVIEQDFVKLIKYIIHAGSKMSRRGYQTEIGEFIRVVNFNGYYDESK